MSFCPTCSSRVIWRDRPPHGFDTCEKGHQFPSGLATEHPTRQMTRYVGGFLFSSCRTLVVLVEKNRPAWQAGLLNGLGGKVEPGESPAKAMAREFYEESGLLIPISDWSHYATLRGPDFEITFFRAFSDDWHKVRTNETEDVRPYPVAKIGELKTAPMVPVLIPLALTQQDLNVVELYRQSGDEAKRAA